MKNHSNLKKGVGSVVTPVVALLLGTVAVALNNWGNTDNGGSPVSPLLHSHPGKPPMMPEVNVGFILAPIAIALLLFTSRQFWMQRKAKNH